MKRIEVVAAMVLHDGRVLATQRGKGEFKDGWEFPGGKIEPGETPREALVREIREELDMDVTPGELVLTVEHDYPAFHLTMHCFLCTIARGAVRLTEHEAARWLTPGELEGMAWLPADVGAAAALKARLTERPQ